MVAMACAFVPSRPVHMMAACRLAEPVRLLRQAQVQRTDESNEPSDLGPLLFSRNMRQHPRIRSSTLQAMAGLGGLALGAHLFVTAADSTAHLLAISPLILALLIAPLATELPEMSNSFLWLYQKKDRLAVGNVTGAMVFQGTVPVSVGLLGTEWTLAPSALVTMVLAVVAAGSLLLQAAWSGQWRPWLLRDRRGPLYRVCDVFCMGGEL